MMRSNPPSSIRAITVAESLAQQPMTGTAHQVSLARMARLVRRRPDRPVSDPVRTSIKLKSLEITGRSVATSCDHAASNGGEAAGQRT